MKSYIKVSCFVLCSLPCSTEWEKVHAFTLHSSFSFSTIKRKVIYSDPIKEA